MSCRGIPALFLERRKARRDALPSMTSEEFQTAILSEDINRIKSVKGIGLKTAQRLILELKDKIVKEAEAKGLYNAIDIGSIWLERELKASAEA